MNKAEIDMNKALLMKLGEWIYRLDMAIVNDDISDIEDVVEQMKEFALYSR